MFMPKLIVLSGKAASSAIKINQLVEDVPRQERSAITQTLFAQSSLSMSIGHKKEYCLSG
jgi:hypothetical protein